MSSRWSEYVRSYTRGSQRELADRTQVNAATISRWLTSDAAPSAEQVIKFARAVGDSPVKALVMAGFVSPDEAQMEVKDFSLTDVDDVVLIAELLERAKARL